MVLNGSILFAAIIFMEFVTSFTHKFEMHGSLWILHKVHHKHLTNERGDCFGMLYIPRKHFKEAKRINKPLFG